MDDRPADNAPCAEPQALAPLQVDVVSVQSQVVYGQVGNTIAVPTFQAHGLRVAAVPTVILSNTPHHPTMHGGPVPLDWFEGYLEDLHARDALRQLKAVVVGYLGGPAQAEALARWLRRLSHARPEVRVFIDPVIGDEDVGVYVDPGMVEAYRDHLLPLADALVPNGFELGLLSGRPVADISQLVEAARALVDRRECSVIVTSAAPATWPSGRMRVTVVSGDSVDIVEHARLETTPKGTGDLFSATLAAHLLTGASSGEATRAACARVLDVLVSSHAARSAEMLAFPPPQG